MTLTDLSLRNAKRQAQDYLVYFITMVLSAALLYAFNGLVFSQEIQELSKHIASMNITIPLASIVVVCIIGWLVSYTTRFMLTRRSRELGTYLLIGLENKQVARLFFRENLAVGGFALVPGLFLGALLFQMLRAIVLTLFDQVYHFALSLSLKAVGLTLVYFLLIYGFSQLRSRKRIRKMKIHDLIYFERQNETAAIQSSPARRRLFVVSILLGVVGTVLIRAGQLVLGIVGAGCIIFFLFGFFLSFASGVPAYFEKHSAQKYRGQTLLIFRTLTAKLSTMGVVMATISLLFTAVLISQGVGTTFAGLFQGRAAQYGIFDLSISSTDPGFDLEEYLDYIHANIPVEESVQYQVYWGENDQVTKYLQNNTFYFRYYEKDMILAYSDYAELRRLLGYPEVELKPGEYLIHCMPYLEKDLTAYQRPVSVGGVELKPGDVHTEQFAQYGWDSNGGNFVLVVPDELAQTCSPRHVVYAANTAQMVTEEDYEALQKIRLDRFDKNPEFSDYNGVHAKGAEEREGAANITMTVFPLYFLAIILIMTAATILTIQQLSEAAHYRQQFTLLRKLGMDRGEMAKALGRQFAIFYAMPVLPALLISVPMVWHTGYLVEPGIMYGLFAPPVIVAGTLALFFLVYGVYILLAYTSLKRAVLPD